MSHIIKERARRDVVRLDHVNAKVHDDLLGKFGAPEGSLGHDALLILPNAAERLLLSEWFEIFRINLIGMT